LGAALGVLALAVALVLSALKAVDAVARRWRWLSASVCDPYRPELYYMRGPGPKWREKYDRGKRVAQEHECPPFVA